MPKGNPEIKTDPNRSEARPILKGASRALILQIGGAGLAFALQVLLARTLGSTQFGLYSMAFASMSIIALVSRCGFGTSLLRFISEYRAKENWPLMQGVLNTAVISVSTLSILISIFIFLGAPYLPAWGFDKISIIRFIGILVIPFALMGIIQAALFGLKLTSLAILPEAIVRPVAFGLIILVSNKLIGAAPSAKSAIILDAIATTTALFIASFALRTSLLKILPSGHTGPSHSHKLLWIQTSLPLLLLTGMQIIFNQTGVLMLGALADPTSAGYYAAAARIARLVLFGLTAINAIAAPLISEYYHLDRIQELNKVLRNAAIGLTAFTIVVGGSLALFGRWLLTFFGPDFPIAYGPMLILLGGQVLNALAGSVGYLMTMTGHQTQALRIVTICAALNLVLNAVLILPFGIWGAAIATAVTVSSWNGLMLIYVRRNLGINPTIFTWRTK